MSVPAMDGIQCPHCQGAAFETVGWDEDALLGSIREVRCLNCGATFLDLSREQRRILREAEERAEEEHERARAEARKVGPSAWYVWWCRGHVFGRGSDADEAAQDAKEWAETYGHPGDEWEIRRCTDLGETVVQRGVL